jgi:hypothetical protein
MEVANKPARGFPTQVPDPPLFEGQPKGVDLGEQMTKGQFLVQEKPPADLDGAISSLVTEEGLCDTQTYYKYETLPIQHWL